MNHMPLLKRKEAVVLAERLVTIRKIEAWTELHTHLLLEYAGKSKGDNGICHLRSEANASGFAFIFASSRIYLKMGHGIHVKSIKRSCRFPRCTKHDMSFWPQKNSNTWAIKKSLADRSVDIYIYYYYY